VSEADVFTSSMDILLYSDSEIPFPSDMDSENRERFYRLKFRAIASLLKESLQGNSLQKAADAVLKQDLDSLTK